MQGTDSSRKLWLAAGATIAFACGATAETADTLTYDGDEAPEKGKLIRPGPLPEPLGRLFPDVP